MAGQSNHSCHRQTRFKGEDVKTFLVGGLGETLGMGLVCSPDRCCHFKTLVQYWPFSFSNLSLQSLRMWPPLWQRVKLTLGF